MQQRIDKEAKIARYAFDSLRDLEAYIASTPPTWSLCSSKENRPSRDWDLRAGYDGATEMAKLGWLEGAQRVQETLKAFRPNATAMTTRNDFYGYRPNVQRYIAGAPDCMIRKAMDTTPAPALRIVMPLTTSAFTSAQSMANLGCALVQLVRQMEQSGTRVELYGASTLKEKDNWRVSFSWRIKRADQPLDLAVVAFAAAHPAMFRRLVFALIERCAAPQSYGYGSPLDTQIGDCINAPTNSIVLNGMRGANEVAKTPKAALAYLRGAVETAAKEGKIEIGVVAA